MRGWRPKPGDLVVAEEILERRPLERIAARPSSDVPKSCDLALVVIFTTVGCTAMATARNARERPLA